jgi:hypothetical protein
MRRSIFALTAAASLTLSIAAAQAQHLYLPRTSHPGDGTVLELVVTNPDPELTRVVTGALLGEGVDGVATAGTPIDQIGVAPKATRIVVVPAGIGLLRLKGYSGLQLSARLRVPGGASQRQGDAVPLLGLGNVVPPNTTVEAQSLIAVTGYLSDVGLFNAGQQAAHCEARVSLADGIQVGPTFVLNVAPLSFTLFENVPNALVAGAQVADARVTMRCDQSFFVLSRTVNPQSGYVSIHTAGTALASGLSEPGAPPPPPPPPPPGGGGSPPAATQVERFTRPGAFFTASPAIPSLLLTMPVTPNVAFSELAVSFTVKHGGWDPILPDGVVNLVYLTRGVFTGDVFALITARGPNRYVVRNEITVDLPQGTKSGKVKAADLQPGTTYHVDYVYDGKAEHWVLTISDSFGPVFNLAGFTTGPVWTQSKPWTILFSQDPGEGHVVSTGWMYSDLEVEWRP